MSELTEYFVRHYTLIIDNDQSSYWPATKAAQRVVRDSGITRSQWLALSVKEREERFADDIGNKVMELINAWFTEAVVPDSIGGQLAHEVMILADSELEWHLGRHYLPEDADIVDFLDDEDGDGDGWTTEERDGTFTPIAIPPGWVPARDEGEDKGDDEE